MAGLAAVNHVVVLMLENRSFDHMPGYLYADSGNVSPSGQPFEDLTGTESCPDVTGTHVRVYPITPSTPNAYFVPGTAATWIMGCFTPQALPVMSARAKGTPSATTGSPPRLPRRCPTARSRWRGRVRGIWTTSPRPIPVPPFSARSRGPGGRTPVTRRLAAAEDRRDSQLSK
jgi:hypothetical protein